MALLICPECGKEISDKVEACPFCGYPFKEGDNEKDKDFQNDVPKNNSGNKNRTLVIAGILVGTLILIFGIFFVIQKNQQQAKIDAFNTDLQSKITESYKERSKLNVVVVEGPYGALINFNFFEPIVDISAIAKNETEKANMEKLLTLTYRLVCYYHFVDRADLLSEYQNIAEYSNDKTFLSAVDATPVCKVFDTENTYEFYKDAQGEQVNKMNGEIVDVEIVN